MPVAARITIAIIASALFICLVRYIFIATRRPDLINHREGGYAAYRKKMAYLTTTAIAYLVVVYGGLDLLFGWIPKSFGSHSGDDYTPFRTILVITLSFLSLSVAAKIHEYVAKSARADELEIVNSELERLFPSDVSEIEKWADYYAQMAGRDSPPPRRNAYKALQDFAQYRLALSSR